LKIEVLLFEIIPIAMIPYKIQYSNSQRYYGGGGDGQGSDWYSLTVLDSLFWSD
jgi:hypothetical protein